MKKLMFIGMVIALLAITGAAFAYPSLLGPTGGANLPVANVVPAGQWNVALDWFNQSSDGVDSATSFRVLYGLGDTLEFGAVYTKQGTNSDIDLDTWGLNAKFLTPLTLADFAWSLGATYQKFNDSALDDAKFYQLYFVGTRVLSEGSEEAPAVRGTVGVNWTEFDFAGFKTDAFRPFVDVDFAFKTGTNVTLEYQFENSDLDAEALSSIVVRHPINENWSAQIGFSNGSRGVVGGDNHDLLIGVNYKILGN